MADTLIGLDIGGTKFAVIEGTRKGKILARTPYPTETERGFQRTFGRLCDAVTDALAAARSGGRAVQALSVSIGGPLDIERGIIYSPPNLPGWDAIPLKDLLYERFHLPVYVEHDGNAGALAEWRFGAGIGTRNLIFLTMGTGLGGGIILNGRLYRGATDLAGEVGHMRIAPDGPMAYGKRGSWEGCCAGPAFAAWAREMFPARWGQDVTTPEITELALAGDGDALAVVERVADYLGQGLAILADILNPEVIVIGSMAVRLGETLLAPARRAMAREALPGTYAACRVVPSALGEGIGDVASLCAAIEGLAGGNLARSS
ncbi:MAG: ROK family protein [Chloroflexi bacterium]|nr:ROK family protein [Chloroflexota bacterium]